MEIDIHTLAAARVDGAVVVDVREPDEYHSGHVPGAHHIPLGELAARVGELAVHVGEHGRARVHVICASGRRSLLGARWLISQGFDAVSVAGGTAAWAEAGWPIETGPHRSSARRSSA